MWKELSDPVILQRLGARVRDYRMRMEMTQSEHGNSGETGARRYGVSIASYQHPTHPGSA